MKQVVGIRDHSEELAFYSPSDDISVRDCRHGYSLWVGSQGAGVLGRCTDVSTTASRGAQRERSPENARGLWYSKDSRLTDDFVTRADTVLFES